MDQIDRRIIGALQQDGRISLTELAERVSLSVSATSERFRRLIEDGVLVGFHAVVDPEVVGRPIHALVDVRFPPGAYAPDLHLDEETFSGVVDAVHLTGPFDLQLRVVATGVDELDRLLSRLKDDLAVEETNTRLILRTIDGFPRPVQPG